MNDIYVVDTNAVISYFYNVFNEPSSISKSTLKIIDKGFIEQNVKLIFPTTIFLEIFLKFGKNIEKIEEIKSEVYFRIKGQENMEIQPFDKEILSNFIKITDIESDYKFDNHDKQIYAAAMAMQCTLITSDLRLIKYNERKNFVPKIIN